ncbi:hypothetical protein ES703_35599 [subsurface metagenome]
MDLAGIEPAAFRMPSERSIMKRVKNSRYPLIHRPNLILYIKKQSQIIKFYYFKVIDMYLLKNYA